VRVSAAEVRFAIWESAGNCRFLTRAARRLSGRGPAAACPQGACRHPEAAADGPGNALPADQRPSREAAAGIRDHAIPLKSSGGLPAYDSDFRTRRLDVAIAAFPRAGRTVGGCRPLSLSRHLARLNRTAERRGTTSLGRRTKPPPKRRVAAPHPDPAAAGIDPRRLRSGGPQCPAARPRLGRAFARFSWSPGPSGRDPSWGAYRP
jgi:hypothetical protein